MKLNTIHRIKTLSEAGLSAWDIHELDRLGRAYNNHKVLECNQPLTDKQEKRGQNIIKDLETIIKDYPNCSLNFDHSLFVSVMCKVADQNSEYDISLPLEN